MHGKSLISKHFIGYLSVYHCVYRLSSPGMSLFYCPQSLTSLLYLYLKYLQELLSWRIMAISSSPTRVVVRSTSMADQFCPATSGNLTTTLWWKWVTRLYRLKQTPHPLVCWNLNNVFVSFRLQGCDSSSSSTSNSFHSSKRRRPRWLSSDLYRSGLKLHAEAVRSRRRKRD